MEKVFLAAVRAPHLMSPATIKRKCQNFLSTLIRLVGNEATKSASVKKLIQNLIDGVIEPEEFSTQLQKDLQSSPQPYLIHFLKQSLQHVRLALISGEMTIDGIRPPSMQSLVPTTHRSLPDVRPALISGEMTIDGIRPPPVSPSKQTLVAITRMPPDVLKTKGHYFLSTVISLAGDGTSKHASNIRKRIQNLIDGVIGPEEFSTRLQKQSNHQPYYIHFLKRSLPYVRQALISGEITIDGIRPPPVYPCKQSLVAITQMSPDVLKTKGHKFLSTLISLAGDGTSKLASNVRKLIQNFLHGVMEPEEFSTQLQKELRSNPPPYLDHFLKRSLPHVRQAVMSGEMTIAGISPPPVLASIQSVFSTIQENLEKTVKLLEKQKAELEKEREEIMEAAKSGNKPCIPKKSETKKELIETRQTSEKNGKLEKHLEKKRKKQSSKDRKRFCK